MPVFGHSYYGMPIHQKIPSLEVFKISLSCIWDQTDRIQTAEIYSMSLLQNMVLFDAIPATILHHPSDTSRLIASSFLTSVPLLFGKKEHKTIRITAENQNCLFSSEMASRKPDDLWQGFGDA